MPSRWQRDEIELGMVITRDELEEPEPLLYKVVAIVDEPTVVIEPLYERDGEDREHYVISSPQFAEFHLVGSPSEPGRFAFDFGSRP